MYSIRAQKRRGVSAVGLTHSVVLLVTAAPLCPSVGGEEEPQTTRLQSRSLPAANAICVFKIEHLL